MSKTYTRCWCCSIYKYIDMDLTEGERLCEECSAKMEAKARDQEHDDDLVEDFQEDFIGEIDALDESES